MVRHRDPLGDRIANGTVNTLAALWIVLRVHFGAAFVAALAGIVFHDSEASA